MSDFSRSVDNPYPYPHDRGNWYLYPIRIRKKLRISANISTDLYPRTSDIIPPHLVSASALPCKTRNTEITSFHNNAVFYFARLQPVTVWLLQSSWLATYIILMYDSLNLIIIGVQLSAVGEGHNQKSEIESFTTSSGTVLHAWCAGILSCWKTKLSFTTCLIAVNICWDTVVK